MTKVHQTAQVSPRAELGNNVQIDAYAVIDEDVVIGDNTWIGSSSRIFPGVQIGKSVKISPMVSIGGEPQDKKFTGEPSSVYVGDNTILREFVTINRGTAATGKTTVGSNCLIMSYAHVAHDCRVGDQVILSNSVQLAGHVHVGDFAILGGMVPVHQFVHIGRHCMVGGAFRVPKDVPPYVLAAGHPLTYMGLNVIGLRRRGFTNDQIKTLKEIYGLLFRSEHNVSQAVIEISRRFDGHEYSKEISEFVSASKRGLMPGRNRSKDEDESL